MRQVAKARSSKDGGEQLTVRRGGRGVSAGANTGTRTDRADGQEELTETGLEHDAGFLAPGRSDGQPALPQPKHRGKERDKRWPHAHQVNG